MTAIHDLPHLGLVRGMPIAAYHASVALSCSGLHDLSRSPLHFHARHLNANRPPDEPTDLQDEGNLAHCFILEPDEVANRYVVGPVNDRRLKAWKDFEGTVPAGWTAIKPEQYQRAQAQALSVRSNLDVAALLGGGEPEVSAFWLDPITKSYCRCRPDWVHPVGTKKRPAVVLADVKTCGDASPADFARQIARMGYHRQAAWYSDGYAIAANTDVAGFVFIAVERDWPFASCAVMIDDEGLRVGRRENRQLLERYEECTRSGRWPGYSEGIEVVSLPPWAAFNSTNTDPEVIVP